MKFLSPARDLWQATYPAAKVPLVKGEFNNEGPPAANNAVGIDHDLPCSPHITPKAPNDYVRKWVAHDLIPEFKARRLSGYNHFLAQAKGASELTNLESQLKAELRGSGAGYIPMHQFLVKPLLEFIDLRHRTRASPTRETLRGFFRCNRLYCRVVRNVLNEFGPSAQCWLMSA